MNNNIYDVAIIGAGPAGSFAAALAAKSGFSTVLLEQKTFPRQKICGGFISSRCLSLFPADLNLAAENFEPVHRLTIASGKKSFPFVSEKMLGLLVKREQFDYLLARYAIKNGAVMKEGFALRKLHKESSKENGQTNYLLFTGNAADPPVKSRHVIGADGALGRCGLLFGLRRYNSCKTGWALAKISEADPASQKPGTLNFYPLPLLGGMGWSFTGPGWVNRGVGGLKNRKGLLKAFRILFPETTAGPEPLSWPLPFLGPLQKSASENLMLVGDAAGLVEPFSGEGLYNSLKSSILAVKALDEAKTRGRDSGPLYQDLFKTHFRCNFALSLAGTSYLYASSIIAPAALPPIFAGLMENKLWYNRGPATQPFE